MTEPRLRPATAADLDDLWTLEVEAGQLFHTVGMAAIADNLPVMAALRATQEQGHIWVAERRGELAGLVIVDTLDGNTHVEQVSVAPEHGRQGVGRRLLEHAESLGRRQGHPATTLTTFRDVSWNGPYYRRLGYLELSPADVGPELAAVMTHEASIPGIDPAARCAMIKPNDLAPR